MNNRSKASFRGDVEQQNKLVLQKESVILLEKALAGIISAPVLGEIVQHSQNMQLLKSQRLNKSMFEISFIITTDRNEVLLRGRAHRNGGRLTFDKEKASLFTSVSIECGNTPANCSDLLNLLHRKLPADAINHADPNYIEFLGIAKNNVYNEDCCDEYAAYYFYVFEVNFNRKDIPELDQIKKYMNGVQDNGDKLYGFIPIKEISSFLSHKFLADREGASLLSKKRKFQSVLNINSNRNETFHQNETNYELFGHTSQAFIGKSPFNDYGKKFFVAYSNEDYENHVEAFLTMLEKNKIPYWAEARDAAPGKWKYANQTVLPQCRGIIVLESQNAFESENVLEEIGIVLACRQRNTSYAIHRLWLNESAKEGENAFKQRLSEYLKSQNMAKSYFVTHYYGFPKSRLSHFLEIVAGKTGGSRKKNRIKMLFNKLLAWTKHKITE